jgi:hypothetical protein
MTSLERSTGTTKENSLAPIRHITCDTASTASCKSCTEMGEELRPAVQVYAGRLGGNQAFILDRNDPDNKDLLDRNPDAAPDIPWRQMFDLRGFRELTLWKQAFVEGIGTLLPALPPPPLAYPLALPQASH